MFISYKLEIFEETLVEWNSSDLVGKFIVNLGLTDVDNASHRQKKYSFQRRFWKTCTIILKYVW
jgi:hypothetical protein